MTLSEKVFKIKTNLDLFTVSSDWDKMEEIRQELSDMISKHRKQQINEDRKRIRLNFEKVVNYLEGYNSSIYLK